MKKEVPGTTKRKTSVFSQYRRCRYLFLLLLPVIIYFVIFKYLPMYGVVMAFQEYYPRQGILGSEWVGFENFKTLFGGIYFGPVLRNTLLISFYKLIFGFPAPIILCLLLNEVRHARFKKTIQTISYLPHFLSWIVLAGIVMEILSPSRGVVNYVLGLFGIDPIFFVGEKAWFRGVIVVSSIWQSIGWQSIVYLAAVSGIDSQMYEAGELDGASRFQMMRYITLPSLMPTITIMFIFAVGGIIQDDFDQIYNLLNPRVLAVGDVISTYTYRVGLEEMNYGYATAVGLFKNVVAVALVVMTNRLSRKMNETSLW